MITYKKCIMIFFVFLITISCNVFAAKNSYKDLLSLRRDQNSDGRSYKYLDVIMECALEELQDATCSSKCKDTKKAKVELPQALSLFRSIHGEIAKANKLLARAGSRTNTMQPQVRGNILYRIKEHESALSQVQIDASMYRDIADIGNLQDVYNTVWLIRSSAKILKDTVNRDRDL